MSRVPVVRHLTVLACVVMVCAFGLSQSSGAPKEQLVKSVVNVAPIALPQVRIDQLDLSGWPKVKALFTVVDGRGAPIELKGLVKVDVLDGSKKATSHSKQNPALVRFEKGVALEKRKDAKLLPRPEAKIGLGAVLVAQGYGSTVEVIEQQRIREGVAAAFKQLGKGDRANLVWYNDRLRIATGVGALNTRLVDAENPEVRKKCADARREARSGGPITLGPAATKDAPAPPAGTDLCGLQADASKPAEFAKTESFSGSFPRLFNLGPVFWDLSRYCGTPSGALEGFGPFSKNEYENAKQTREDAKNRGEAVDFETSAMDVGLGLLAKDGRPDEQLALVLLSDGRDGWVQDLSTCAEHPPKPCDMYDASGPVNIDRIAKMGDKQKMIENHRLQVELKRCVETNKILTGRVALMQKQFHAKAQQWIGVARAAGIRIFAVGLRRPGVVTNPYDLERLRLLADRTGGTYREVGIGMSPVTAVNRTMAEVAGQIALEFKHLDPDAVVEAAGDTEPTFSLRLSVTIDAKLEREDNPGTQFASEPVTLPLPKALSLWRLLKDLGWSLLVRIQMLMGYDVYVIVGYVLTIGALLLSLLIIWKIGKRLFRSKPKAT